MNNTNRKEPIEKSYTPKTVRALKKKRENLKFDLIIQRGNAWTNEQRSLFIHSLIYGYPFPPLYSHDTGDGNFWMLDGKQRLTTVLDFTDNKFALHSETPEAWGEPIAGKKFEDLSEDMQDEILAINFVIYQLKGMTDEERDEMFVRLNGGTALSKFEVTRAVYSEFFETIDLITRHELFYDCFKLTKSSINKFVDEELAVQILMMKDDKWSKGLGANQMRDYIEEMKAKGVTISDDYAREVNKVMKFISLNTIGFTDKEKKSVFKKGNVPIIYKVAEKYADQEEVIDENFSESIRFFFNEGYDPEGEYSESLRSGSLKPSNIATRIAILDNVIKGE